MVMRVVNPLTRSGEDAGIAFGDGPPDSTDCDLTLGLTCVEKGADATTVWRMRVDERFLNPAGIVQGGFLSAMMDSAMGASAVLSVKDRKVFVRQHRNEVVVPSTGAQW